MLFSHRNVFLKMKNWGMVMAFDRTTSQVLFDDGTHKCINFTNVGQGEGYRPINFKLSTMSLLTGADQVVI